jgi:hypothetical protein
VLALKTGRFAVAKIFKNQEKGIKKAKAESGHEQEAGFWMEYRREQCCRKSQPGNRTLKARWAQGKLRPRKANGSPLLAFLSYRSLKFQLPTSSQLMRRRRSCI